jgi:hypothetical protein
MVEINLLCGQNYIIHDLTKVGGNLTITYNSYTNRLVELQVF